MKILFADKYPESHLQRLRGAGHECDLQPELTGDDLGDAIVGFEAVVVRSTAITPETLNHADVLQLIIRAGSGTNTIAVSEAVVRGIQVSNVPGMNAVAVAELAMGLIIAIDRNIADNVADLREGRWDKKKYSVARGVSGRRLGLVGVGAVALALAERAAAFGMDVVAVEKDRSDEVNGKIRGLGIELVGDDATLLAGCDVVSIHVPHTGAPVVDADFVSHLQPGAILINTSRGDVVDEESLIEAMDAKGIRAGLDVFADEPATAQAEFTSRLAQHPNVYGTHHIGASTTQAQNAVAEGVIDIIEAFGRGEALNPVGRS